jgi:hypothetical protein
MAMVGIKRLAHATSLEVVRIEAASLCYHFTSHSELRSPTGSNLRRIVAKRDRHETVCRKLLWFRRWSRRLQDPDVRLATSSS